MADYIEIPDSKREVIFKKMNRSFARQELKKLDKESYNKLDPRVLGKLGLLEKPTQGSRKFYQYFEDLKRNEVFQQQLDEVRKFVVKGEVTMKGQSAFNESALKIAEDYDLDNDLVLFLIFSSLYEDYENEDKFRPEMCTIVDTENEAPYRFDTFLRETNDWTQRHYKAFPISLDIHLYAAKNDVLDFIEKCWPQIEENLVYRRMLEYKGDVKFRERTTDQKVIDFIWDNRNMKARDIEKELKKKFPECRLAYFEISKIISLEKKRRQKKIIIGR